MDELIFPRPTTSRFLEVHNEIDTGHRHSLRKPRFLTTPPLQLCYHLSSNGDLPMISKYAEDTVNDIMI